MLFAMKAAYLLIDKIKEKDGCQICKRQPLDLASLIFFDVKKKVILEDEQVALMKFKDFCGGPGVVCLDCIQRLRKIKIPPIGEKPREAA